MICSNDVTGKLSLKGFQSEEQTDGFPEFVMPFKVFYHIFQFLSPEERFKCRTVCRQWLVIVPFPEIGETLTEIVKKTNILTVQIFHVVRKDLKTCSNIATNLQKADVLSAGNFYAASVRRDAIYLPRILEAIREFVDQIDLGMVLNHENLYVLSREVSILQKSKILNADNFIMIATQKGAGSLATCYEFLHKAGIPDERIKWLLSTCSVQIMTRVFETLRDKNMLTKENVETAFKYEDKESLIWIINHLSLLDASQFDPFILPEPNQRDWYVLNIFVMLKSRGGLSEDNKEIVLRNNFPSVLCKAICSIPSQDRTSDVIVQLASLDNPEEMEAVAGISLNDINLWLKNLATESVHLPYGVVKL